MGDWSLEWYKLRNWTQKEVPRRNTHLTSSNTAALCDVGIQGQRKPFQVIPLNEWKVKAERWNAAKRVWSACCREMWSFGEGRAVDWNSLCRYFYFLKRKWFGWTRAVVREKWDDATVHANGHVKVWLRITTNVACNICGPKWRWRAVPVSCQNANRVMRCYVTPWLWCNVVMRYMLAACQLQQELLNGMYEMSLFTDKIETNIYSLSRYSRRRRLTAVGAGCGWTLNSTLPRRTECRP